MNNTSLGQIKDVNGLVTRLAGIGTVVIYLLIGLGLIYIIWAIVQYLIKGREGDENRRQAGMQIFWGVVGLAVIMSMWGLVNIVVNTFWTNNNRPAAPNANFINSSTNSSTNSSGNAGVQQ